MIVIRISRRSRSASVRNDLLLAISVLLALGGSGAAEPADDAEGSSSAPRLDEVVVRGRQDSLVGIADAASEGSVGAEQIARRTLSRPGEVLETVPGLIVTQHSGAGKANQYFLRGFNLDHGTDFATSIDGVPINMPSHGHGQGYTDLNFLIPELVEFVDFRKGPYNIRDGDFASAGAANLRYFDTLEKGIAQVEGGRFNYYRGLLADSLEAGPGNLLYGVELFYNDGPWEHPDRFKKLNGMLRYSGGDRSGGFRVTASAYVGDWDATDQIAARAVHEIPGFGRFDSLDTSTGGFSQKYMLYGEAYRADADSETELLLYGFFQELNLYSNFTYLLTSPQGDQFEQLDRRWVGGAKAHHTWFAEWIGNATETTFGIQVRSDWIHNGLYQTIRRDRTEKVDYDDESIPSTTRRDGIRQTSVSPYFESRIQWSEWLRSIAGIRLDGYFFDVGSSLPDYSGRDSDALVSPRGTLVFGPWFDTELYLSGGLGFHSNDARGVTDPVDPADPLVQTRGAELGVRSTWIPGLQSTVAVWYLRSQSELLFVGDEGTTEPTRSSRRYGIEIANYYSPLSWLTFDADVALSHARYRNPDEVGRQIPSSVETVVAAGATVHDLSGPFGAIRLRYLGPRPLVEDGTVDSDDTVLLSAQVGYEFDETWTLSAEVYNLLNRSDSEIDYYYASRLPGEDAGPDDGGINDLHFHPVDPISFRIALTARF